MSTLRKAKVTPTASASILVATARGTMVFYAEGIILAFSLFRFFPGFLYHIQSDKAKEDKRNPVINTGDKILELGAQQITD